MNAAPPSEMMEQSYLVRGSAMTRELITSSTVRGSLFIAFSLRAACLRMVTATAARCSRVAPKSWRYLCAASA